jgi:hypothetical protein
LISPFLVADSITRLPDDAAGRVVIAGSHCGVYAAYLAAKAQLRAVILNDAGVGRDRAGIAGLGYLADLGIAAATIANSSARIGDGADGASRGIISYANGLAAELGCRPGQSAAAAASCLVQAPIRPCTPPAAIEGRHRIEGPWNCCIEVWALDSVSLVRTADRGAIVVTGSHGGLLGGDPATALGADALAALFSDAGGGIDSAGFTRLPVLDRRGIAAATVDAMKARIGDGRSTYRDGVLTRVNATAAALGARVGMTARDFVAMAAQANPRSTG